MVGVDRVVVVVVILEFLTIFGQDMSKIWETALYSSVQFCISDVLLSMNYFTLMYLLIMFYIYIYIYIYISVLKRISTLSDT